MHVMEAPAVGLLPADRMRRALAVLVIPGVVAQVRCVIAKAIRSCGPRTARILPLGFRGEAKHPFTLRVQLLNESPAVVPVYALHRQVVSLEFRRMAPRDRLPLCLRHLGLPQPEPLGNGDLMLHLVFIPVLLTDCLLYTSDAADDLLCVDLGGRRIIKKKTTIQEYLKQNK